MKNAKVRSARHSFLMSVLSLILCFTMLLGTTFAWFTDSETSGKNRIIAGNLDVELYHSTTGTVTDDAGSRVTESTMLFGVDKWEPGVIAYENFMVKNVGSLALKYQLSMNVGEYNETVEGRYNLKQVLKVAVVENGFNGDRAAAQALPYTTLDEFFTRSSGSLLPNATGDQFGVVIYWEPGENDNNWNLNNGKKATVVGDKFGETALGIELGVNLFATQLEHESDSFDNTYDADAGNFESSSIKPIVKPLAVPVEGDSRIVRAPVEGETLSLEVTNQNMTVTYTEGTKLTESTKIAEGAKTADAELGFEYVNETSNIGVSVGDNEKLVRYELTLNIAQDNGILNKVTKTLPKDLLNVKVYHNSTTQMAKLASQDAKPETLKKSEGAVESCYYDKAAGVLTLWVFHASEVNVTYDTVFRKTELPYNTVKFGEEDIKIVTFAGKEWVVMEEDENTALILMKDNVGAEYFNTNNSPLYKDSDYDKAMNAYYDTLSSDDKEILAKAVFKESVYIAARDGSGVPGVYLEAGDQQIDEYVGSLKLQGVELTDGQNAYDIERYVFAISYEEANAFGAEKLASIENNGLLEYTSFGDCSDLAFYLRTSHTFRTGFICDGECDGSLSYAGAPYYKMGVRPAVRIDLTKAALVANSNS